MAGVRVLLAAALVLIGGGATASAAEQPLAAIRVEAPRSGEAIAAQRVDHRRLTAVIALSGTAQPGAQLSLVGSCGRVDCAALTYADAAGRWHTRVQMTTPRGRREVRLRISYWPAPPGRAPVAARLNLRASVPVAPQAPALPPAGALPTPGTTPELVMIGDSLAIGTAQALTLELPEWRVRFDARVGRPLSEGMQILAESAVTAQRTAARTILAFSLYTNDAPTDPGQLEGAVRASVARLGPHGCAIWATISRRAVHGVSYRAANARLLALAADPALAGRLFVVPWAEQVALHHEWKGPDHVHATATGNVARARMYADAARACA
jgi:hypothetical protein